MAYPFRLALPFLAMAATAAHAASESNPSSTRPTEPQIMEACMKIEHPAALKRLGLGPIRTREDAGIFAQGVCRTIVQDCAANPVGDVCQRALVGYGMGDPGYVPSLGAALFDASYAGATATVSRLLASGADPNWRNRDGWTPLMIAAAERHLDTVAALLAAKADPNARNVLGRTALMFASRYGQDAIAERLLAAGADPNIVPGDQGWTALIAAAAHGHVRTVELLLRAGADPTIRAKDGQTALDIARGERHAEVVRVLEASDGRKPRK